MTAPFAADPHRERAARRVLAILLAPLLFSTGGAVGGGHAAALGTPRALAASTWPTSVVASGYLSQGNSYLQDTGIHSPTPGWNVLYQTVLPPAVASLNGAFSWMDAGYGGSLGKVSLDLTDLSTGATVQYLNGTSQPSLGELWYNFSTPGYLLLNVSASYRLTLAGYCSLSATCLVGDGTTAHRALFLAFNRSTLVQANRSSPLLASVGAPSSASFDLPLSSSSVVEVDSWTNSLSLVGAPAGWAMFDNLSVQDLSSGRVLWTQSVAVTQPSAVTWRFWPQLSVPSADLIALELSTSLSGAAAGSKVVAVGGSGHPAWNLTLAAPPFLALSVLEGPVPLPVGVSTSSLLVSGTGRYHFTFETGNGSIYSNASATSSATTASWRYNWTGAFAPQVFLAANLSSTGITYWAASGAPGPLAVLVVAPPPMVVSTDPSPPDGVGPLLVNLLAWQPPRGSMWHYTITWGTPGGTTVQNGTGNASWTYPASPLGTYPLNVSACVFPPGHTGGNLCVRASPTIEVSTEVTPSLHPSRGVTDAGVAVAFTPAETGGSGHYSNFSWDFGDGTRAYGNLTLTHVYANPGTYRINLTVVDSDGNVGSTVLSYRIAPELWANASASPTVGPAPLPVELTESISGGTTFLSPGFPAGVGNASVAWRFPRGGEAGGQLLTQVFSYPGTYPVECWVNDTGGSHRSANLSIEVTGDAQPFGWATPRGPVSQSGASDGPGPRAASILASADLGPGSVVGISFLSGEGPDGTLLVADANGTLWGLDGVTLHPLWRTGLAAFGEVLKGGPSSADGTAFLLGGSSLLGATTLFAFNASTGALRWKLNVDPANWPSGLLGAPVPVGGQVFVTSPDFLSAVNLSTGALLWQESLFGTDPGYTMAYGDSYLFGQSPPTYWAPASVNAFSTRSQGYGAFPDGISSGAYTVYEDGMVSLAGPAGQAEGAISGTPPYWDATLGGGAALLPPAVADGRVFLTNGSGPLFALSELNGSLLWERPGPIVSAPVVGGEQVYVGVRGSSGDVLESLSAESGVVDWQLNLSAAPATLPAIGDGILYFAGPGGDITAVGAQPLRVSVSTPATVVSAGVPVSFQALSSGGSGPATVVAWLFSDGTTANGTTVGHTFSSPGSAWARAVAVDAQGDVSAPSEVDLSVLAAPLAPSVVVSSDGVGAARVAWTPNSGPDFASYQLFVGIDGAPLGLQATISDPTTTSWVLRDLPLDALVEVQAGLNTTLGSSNLSNPVFWKVPLVGPALSVSEGPGHPGEPVLSWSLPFVDHFAGWQAAFDIPVEGWRNLRCRY
ncbi:MAG: PQQ-binding-like beta-propeller repeat protein [Euryarchaeota archaeon]|nr:PQQ-binding-like beta-propeller repeat protein [Euryarchaeota archaeon]